jgi:acyl-CoA thioester hydrolase
VAGIPIHQSAVLPEWIDYNGHLRDAYYGLIFSEAIDSLMDRIGLDAAYRARTGCTLYTLEMHTHFLREVKQDAQLQVLLRVLAADAKRVHAALELWRAGESGAAAAAEVLLLHVRQHEGGVATAPFPSEVSAAIAELQRRGAAHAADAPGSRRLELKTRPPAP